MKTFLIAALLIASNSCFAYVYKDGDILTARCKSPADGKVQTFTGSIGNFDFTSLRTIEIKTKTGYKIFPIDSCEFTISTNTGKK